MLTALSEPGRALEELRRINAEFKAASLRRHEAIVAASHAGNALRDISAAIDCELSYEVIRGIVGPRAGVAFEWQGEIFQVSEPQTRALIYKAEGYGRGAFPGDVEKLDAGERWLLSALDLARSMRRVHVGLDSEPIELDREHAFALYQILRLTYMDGLSRLADLRSSLFNSLGQPAPTGRRRR